MIGLYVLVALYCLFVAAMLLSWRRATRRPDSAPNSMHPKISVVVPVRNDATALQRLLRTLERQEMKPLEVIIVDDHSEDDLVNRLKLPASLEVRIVANRGEGKKAAITTGVTAARGDLIATTDADCEVPPAWLTTFARMMTDPKVSLVFGPVSIRHDGSFFSTLQSLEFASLVGSSATTAAWELHTMCNGASLCYRKEVFERVHGYEGNLAIASGDDEFLMHKVRVVGGVRFAADPSAVVTTAAQPSIPAFVSQRLRWASKWKHNRSWFPRVLATLIVAAQIAFLGILISLFSGFTPLAAIIAAIKVGLEGIFLAIVCRFLRVRWSLSAFLVLQPIYPLYVTMIGCCSLFMSTTWKGRSLVRSHPELGRV